MGRSVWPRGPPPPAHTSYLSLFPRRAPSPACRVCCCVFTYRMTKSQQCILRDALVVVGRAHTRGERTHTRSNTTKTPQRPASVRRTSATLLAGCLAPRDRGAAGAAALPRTVLARTGRASNMQSDMENSCVVALKAHSNTSTMTR